MSGRRDRGLLDPHGAYRDGNGLSEAIRLAERAERRAPTEAAAPPCSTFPLTRAAREALRIRRETDAAV